MKHLFVFIVVLFFCNQSTGQKTNIKAGLWSDNTVWSNNKLPSSLDDIELAFDITIDVNTVCQSLTLNGHNVTINSGVNFNVIGSTTATILSMYIDLDTSALAPYDTISKTLFYYDSSKRNTGIDFMYYDNGVPGEKYYKSSFYYNGIDSLPFKKIVTTPFLPSTDPDFYEVETFYSYINYKLTKDSSRRFPVAINGTLVNDYVYNTAGIIVTTTGYDNNLIQDYTTTKTYYLKFLNGNISRQTDSTDYTLYNSIDVFDYTYDDHPNPFYSTQNRVSLDYTYPIYSHETTVLGIFEKNNVKEVNQLIGNYYNYHYQYIYEYRTNGYPKTVRYNDQNTPDNFGKGLYFYTN